VRAATGLREDRRQQTCVEQVAAAEVFGFWSAQSAFGGLAQCVHFLRLKLTQVARLLIEDQRAIADAADFFDEMADFLEHLAQFAVAALDENDLVPGIVALADLTNAGRGGADGRRARFAALDGDAAAENVQLCFSGLAGNLDKVSFFHARGGLGEAIGELAVVGDNEKALAHVIETANGVEALLHLVEELHHRGAALGVLDRGDEAAGLVENEVAVALGALEQLAVYADVVAAGVGLGAQHGDHLAVDLHAALLDHALGAAAAGDTGSGENLLEALQLGRGTRLGSELRLGVGFGFFYRFRRGVGFKASLRNDVSLRG
jgi:hypothetical protein